MSVEENEQTAVDVGVGVAVIEGAPEVPQELDPDATRLATDAEYDATSTGGVLLPQPIAAGSESRELALASLPPVLLRDDPRLAVPTATDEISPLVPVQHHRVGGTARLRVHHTGDHQRKRVGRDSDALDPTVPRYMIPGDVLELLCIALVEDDSQEALKLLAPYYSPSLDSPPMATGIIDVAPPREI